jgi:hypothetical protein
LLSLDPEELVIIEIQVRPPVDMGGPERPMLLVEQRAPGGFTDIDEVITPAEIAEVTNDYRRTAGFAIADLKRRAPLIEEPYPSS